MRVVCAGHVNWDVTIRVDRLPAADGESRVRDRREAGGGSAANVAVALVALDCEAALVGSVGTDPAGVQVRETLDAAGVDVTAVVKAAGQTARKYLLVDDHGEVAVIDDGGVNEAVAPGDVESAWFEGAAYCHLTSQRPETAARLAEAAGEEGVPISFDPGRRLDSRDYSATLERTDLLFLNEREANGLPRGAVAPTCTVVTKHGERGATLDGPDRHLEHRGFDLDGVDTTGAGDAFAAGFLAAGLHGAADRRRLAVANACGALTAATEGPRADLSWDRLSALVDG
jgi:ribokinase